ncbi:MAG: hypothetical protein V1792_23110 [Pseudomonadota bacterium]
MALPLLLPLRILGWAAAGVALGVGWKVGSHLVETAMSDPRVKEFIGSLKSECKAEEAPLWKRKYSRLS